MKSEYRAFKLMSESILPMYLTMTGLLRRGKEKKKKKRLNKKNTLYITSCTLYVSSLHENSVMVKI